MNLVQGSVFWWTNLGLGGSRFGIFKFVPISNGKFAHFLIFYVVRTFGSVQGSVFFGRFEAWFERTNLGSGGSRFSFLKVWEV